MPPHAKRWPTSEELALQLTSIALGRWYERLLDEPSWGQGPTVGGLDAIVRALRPAIYENSPLAALEQVLEDAVTHARNDKVERSKITFRRGISLMFRIGHGMPVLEPGGKRYDRVVEVIVKEAGLPFHPKTGEPQPGPRNNLTRALRRELAIVLLRQVTLPVAINNDSQREQSKADDGSILKPPWISRAALEQQINHVVEARDHMPLILWGESGNGKTVAARRVVERYFKDNQPIWLRGPDGPRAPFFDSDVVAALQTKGVRCEGWSSAACQLKLAELIRTPDSFDIVILDNVDTQIIARLCSNAAVPVIVTSRYAVSEALGTTIRVGQFDREEAIEFCRTLLPKGDPKQLSDLAIALGHRPLALDLACRLVATGFTDIAGLLNSFAVDLPETLTAAVELLDESIDRNLLHTYAQVLESLHEERSAANVLRVIAWWAGSNHLQSIRAALISKQGRSAFTDISLRGALKTLESRGLIEVSGENLTINTLTEDIIRSLTRDTQVDELYDRLFEYLIRPALNLVDRYAGSEISLEKLIRGLDVPPPDPGALRFTYRFEAAGGAIALSSLNAGRLIGGLALSRNVWFLWQDGIEFSQSPAAQTQYALMVIKPTGITFWGTGVEGAISFETAAISVLLVGILNRGIDSLVDLATDVENLWVYGPGLRLIPERRDAMVYHSGLPGAVPERTLARLDCYMWARCGALYSPKDQAAAEPRSPCVYCEQTTGSLADTVTHRMNWLLYLVHRLNERVEWSVAHNLCATLARLNDHPERLLQEALRHAKRGEIEGDESHAAVRVLWTEIWLHELALERNDIAAALSLEYDILTRTERGVGIIIRDEPALICHQLASHWTTINYEREFALTQRAIDYLAGTGINPDLLATLRELLTTSGPRS